MKITKIRVEVFLTSRELADLDTNVSAENDWLRADSVDSGKPARHMTRASWLRTEALLALHRSTNRIFGNQKLNQQT